MSAVLGALLLAVTAVLYRWAFIHHRRPVRSAWARNAAASMLVQFLLLLTLAVGSCFAIRAIVTLPSDPITPIEGAAVLASVAVAMLLFRVLNRQWRQFQAEAPRLDGGELPVPANDPGAGLPPQGGLVPG